VARTTVAQVNKEDNQGDAPYGSRVYSYVSDEGHTYWSFHRSPTRIVVVNRLELKERQGEFYAIFLSRARRLAHMFARAKPTPDWGETDD